MLIQKGQIPDSNRPIWIVLDDNYLPVEPIQKYLRYLDSLEKSPNTIRVYANNLKLFWEFLRDKKLDWKEVNLEQMSDFIHWLRSPDPGVISMHPQVSKRAEKTINHALTTVCSFYEFQEHLGIT
ncbi:site-specific integrase, partial [Fischerella sp. PCC 9605]